MTEQELMNAIFEKSNNYALMTGLHAANVAYVPEKWKFLCTGDKWKIINGKVNIINRITIFYKPNEQIFVNYMENPSDEMRNIPTASEVTKQRSFIKIGRYRFDVSDIVGYYIQSKTGLYIQLRYCENAYLVVEREEVIKKAIQDLDIYFNVQIML